MDNETVYLTLTGRDTSYFDSLMNFWVNKEIGREYDFYVETACLLIQNYLCFHEQWVNIRDTYPQAVTMLAAHLYNMNANIASSSQNSGIKQISSNGRSVTFMTVEELASQSAIPQFIKDMLPHPTCPKRVRVW